MNQSSQGGASAPAAQAFVPMIHVASVARSIAFYELLGFAIGNVHRVPQYGDELIWAWMQSPAGAQMMLVRADGPVDDGVQAVLFYVYCDDVDGMRERVLAAGFEAGPMGYPFYRPRGEFRSRDPDGYVLMITHSQDD
ncbi:hypothetical protein SAMN04487939_101470 [Lysobacter sp. yr284]|uniref:VOC family protein n=1 Tax=Lysobacter sp. yr284 TaxID=1761791 RepID=UPI0008985B99|nr:VOC family protein [Lysobacter sp. yr284]SDY25103.1 hypothetical protein SAMN04487939_101470 [Lysobacter sp. yr284]